jgi:prepilin-type N-terminal cleavage/methylation domain-containing protein
MARIRVARNAGKCICEMKLLFAKRTRAFTLLELLVVIAIIAVVAALVVGLAGVASEKQKLSRARAEGDRIATMIETYRLKLGVYPPCNAADPGKNSLAYELAGAYIEPATPDVFQTPWGPVTSNQLFAEFGVPRIFNSSDDKTEIKRILKSLKPDQFVESGPANLKRLVIPIDDPSGNRPNFWLYRSTTNETDKIKEVMRNPDGFDLWVEMKVGKILGANKVVTNGNWKD